MHKRFTSSASLARFSFFTVTWWAWGSGILIFLSTLFLPFYGFSAGNTQEKLAGSLTIFHAGSLALPFHKIAKAFKAIHPDVEFRMEAAGSIESARKVTDLGRRADVVASADYEIIERLLLPNHASWVIKFATNEITLAYRKESRRSSEIGTNNWFEILKDKNVSFGRSDPNSDPCGYRSLFTLQLAERYYNKPQLYAHLAKKDLRFIRPKEIDLLALLELGTLDYIFIYRSVAEQHGLKYLILPNEINLKNSSFSHLYADAKVEIRGKNPLEFITQRGAPMEYGVTIPREAPNPKVALAFVEFVLSSLFFFWSASLSLPFCAPF